MRLAQEVGRCPMAEREHDIVLFGATGFTGALTAEYLAGAAPTGALGARRTQPREARGAAGAAGRRRSRCIEADVNDPASMRRLAESTQGRHHHRRPLHQLRRAARRRLRRSRHRLRRPHRRARVRRPDVAAPPRAGASAPAPGSCTRAALTRSPTTSARCSPSAQLPEGVPIKLEGFVRAGGTFSGGTLHSAVHIMARLRQGRQVAAQRRRLEPQPGGRRVRGDHRRAAPRRRPPAAGSSPLPPSTPAPCCAPPGPWTATAPTSATATTSWPSACRWWPGSRPAPAPSSPWPSCRRRARLLLKLKDPGDGPSPEQRAKAWFKVRSAARAAAGGSSPRSAAATRAMARRRRCWPRRRCAWPTTTCPTAPASSPRRWPWARR